MKTSIPYDRSGDPSEGCGVITISAYGTGPEEAQAEFQRMRSESRIQGQPSRPQPVGNRFVVTWKETMKKMADVIPFTGRWAKRKKEK